MVDTLWHFIFILILVYLAFSGFFPDLKSFYCSKMKLSLILSHNLSFPFISGNRLPSIDIHCFLSLHLLIFLDSFYLIVMFEIVFIFYPLFLLIFPSSLYYRSFTFSLYIGAIHNIYLPDYIFLNNKVEIDKSF